jgi:ABC-type transport system involved in Fe-S cluster assembly fused permease/ATPase subunit
VTIDGVDVRRVTLESLRSRMAVVFQENMLFNMSIRKTSVSARRGRPTRRSRRPRRRRRSTATS